MKCTQELKYVVSKLNHVSTWKVKKGLFGAKGNTCRMGVGAARSMSFSRMGTSDGEAERGGILQACSIGHRFVVFQS